MWLTLIYVTGLLAIGLAALYVANKVRNADKICVYRITGERFLLKSLVKPDDLGVLKIDKKAYTFAKQNMLYTRSAYTKEWRPSLLYLEGDAQPIDPLDPYRLETPEAEEGDPTNSSELHSILDSHVARDFMLGSRSKVTNDKLMGAVVLLGVVMGGLLLAAVWWLQELIKAS